MKALAVMPLLLLAACDQSGERAKLADAKYRATLESRGIGRFQMIPASGEFPPFVLDTVTGCVEVVSSVGGFQKMPVGVSDKACLGDMPHDTEREIMETLKK